MPPPLVSVLMLNLNHRELLVASVRSMLDQTWRDLEVIVVDNGSTDDSVARLAAEVSDPRLRIERLPRNLGIPAGLRHGVSLCRGEFVALQDSDDLSHPRRLELQLAALAAEPGLSGVSCDARMIDAAGRELGEWRSFHQPDDIRAYADYNMPLHHPGLVVRRSVFAQVIHRDIFDLASDFDFMSRAVVNHRFASLPVLLYDYRRHAGSVTYAHEQRSMVYRGLVRLAAARRRAGRPERLEEFEGLKRRLLADDMPLWRIYLELAAVCRREGHGAVAALHAALAVRQRPGPRTVAAYARCLLAALWREPRKLALLLGGLSKGPFWLLLKERGFPAFPRY